MKMNFGYLMLLTAFMLLLTTSCNEVFCSQCRCKDMDIHVTRATEAYLSNKGEFENYCTALEKAVVYGDSSSIHFLSTIELFDGVGYDHGVVLVKLVGTVGEYRFVRGIEGLGRVQKASFRSYLVVGLENFDDEKYRNKDIDRVFPMLSAFLKQ